MLSEWNELYLFPRCFTDHDILGILNTGGFLKNAPRLIDPSGDGMFEDVCKGEAHHGYADFSVAHLCLEILDGPLEVWEAAAASSLSSTLVSFNSWLQQLELFPNKMSKKLPGPAKR